MVSDPVARLQTQFGFTDFRPGQAEAIRCLLNGQHALVVMPTGAGKSLIYQLTSVFMPGITLVISPLIALMKDQVDGLVRHQFAATFINSTLSSHEQLLRLKNLAAGMYRLVYIAPERLRSVPFQEILSLQKISLLAVDEAHCISEWGHDFRPDYLYIAQFRATLGDPLTVALTATATPQEQDEIIRLLNIPNCQRIVTGFNRPNLTLKVQYNTCLSARLRILQHLLTDLPNGCRIIYTGTRRDSEEVADFVRAVSCIHAEHYHAGLSAEKRNRIHEAFISGKLQTVVATNAFGMGIDRPDVRQVIHFSIPGSLEAYYQEAGRAGRDGQPAQAVLLYSPEDRALQEWFIKNSVLSMRDLHKIFDTTQASINNRQAIVLSDLCLQVGLPEIKVRVGLAELERAGMIDHPGDKGVRMQLATRGWNEKQGLAVIVRLKQYQELRRQHLERMVAYAESHRCRRMIILQHFGDPGSAEAQVCCDNCAKGIIVEGWIRNQLSTASRAPEKKPLENSNKVLLKNIVDIGEKKSISGIAVLIDALKSPDGNIRRLAASALGKVGDPRAVQPLLDLLVQEKKPQVRQYAVKALGRMAIDDPAVESLLGTIVVDNREKDYTRQAARNALRNLSNQLQKPADYLNTPLGHKEEEPEDIVATFLSRPHPRSLSGPWDSGWALDFHSRFTGGEWNRTETGELTYRLKYQGDLSILPALLEQVVALTTNYPEFAQVDAIMPVPPSTPRPYDPVHCFAEALSQRLDLAFLPVLAKTRRTNLQKDMQTLAQKQANVFGAFKLRNSIRGKRLLVVDDLFDSGATFIEITRILRRAGAGCVYVLALTRSIHSSS